MRFTRAQALLLSCCAAVLLVGFSPRAQAQQLAFGPHGGINLDVGSLHVGLDLLVGVSQISPAVQLAVWPSYAHVFVDDGHDVELFGVDVPFVFALPDSPMIPYVGPGLGLAVYGENSLKVNVIGGVFFETDSPVRPFAELAIRLVNGTFVDLLGGVLFEL